MSGGLPPGGAPTGTAIAESRQVEVCTGEVATGGPAEMLVASALGSCVAVAAHDPVLRVGGIAHVMLPGAAPPGDGGEPLRYAENAVAELIDRLLALGSPSSRLQVSLAGGGNVLGRPDDTVCARNVASVTAILARRGLRVAGASLGGTLRRRLVLEVATGRVRCAVGDGPEGPLPEAGA